MKCLRRNKSTFYYKLWEDMAETEDEDGNILETNVPLYSDIKSLEAYSTSEQGQAFSPSITPDLYGLDVNYTKIIITEDMNCPVTDKDGEAPVFYIDNNPYNDEPYDYVVTRVSRLLNHVQIQMKRVEVS